MNEQGMLEAGLDYGGLVKEFLEQVSIAHCTLLQKFYHILSASCIPIVVSQR